MVFKLTLLYKLERWLIRKVQLQKLMVAEMTIIKRMCSYTRVDKIRNC